MKRFSRLSTVGAAILAVGVLGLGTGVAQASHDVYPPGWNKPDPNVPKSMFDFRAGWGWDDYQRYWPDQTDRGGSAKSRPIPDAPAIYGMMPNGHRYHRTQ